MARKRGVVAALLRGMKPGPLKTVVQAVSQISASDVVETLRVVEQIRQETARLRETRQVDSPSAIDPAITHARVLGLPWPCTRAAVVTSFRTLAATHHPDAAHPDAARLQACVEARNYLLTRVQA